MRPRWLIVGLVVSVVLNLFLIGAGAGVIALGARMAHDSGAARPGALFWATQRLPQPARANLRAVLRGVRDQLGQNTAQSRTLRLQAWGSVADPKPDVAAIKQALAQSRQLDIAARTKVEESIVDFAMTLPPAERAALSAGFRQELTGQPPATGDK
jgi:uncharacterized membrane protein